MVRGRWRGVAHKLDVGEPRGSWIGTAPVARSTSLAAAVVERSPFLLFSHTKIGRLLLGLRGTVELRVRAEMEPPAFPNRTAGGWISTPQTGPRPRVSPTKFPATWMRGNAVRVAGSAQLTNQARLAYRGDPATARPLVARLFLRPLLILHRSYMYSPLHLLHPRTAC